MIYYYDYIQDCANAKKHPPYDYCLQNQIFLWKANNYRCYSMDKGKHDASARLCKNCASPRKFGEALPCPLHGKSFMSYCKSDDEAKEFQLAAIIKQEV